MAESKNPKKDGAARHVLSLVNPRTTQSASPIKQSDEGGQLENFSFRASGPTPSPPNNESKGKENRYVQTN